MKSLCVLFACAALACAQAPPAAPAPAAPPAADLKPDTVVATAAGRKVTAGDVTQIVNSLPPQMRQNYYKDPKGFLAQWYLLERLVKMAEEAKLDQQSPYKEGIRLARMQVLWQAQIEEASKQIVVTAEDQKKEYEAKKDGYSQAKLKIIYVAFAAEAVKTAGGKKTLSEAEAQAKAADLVKQIRGGADFVKLVKEHSEDPVSAAKDGDFGPVKKTDNLPEAIKTAIFQLKPGEVSEPLRQPNGFYIFRLEGLAPQPFEEVKDNIFAELKNTKLRQWMEGNQKAVDLKVENQAFFSTATAQQP